MYVHFFREPRSSFSPRRRSWRRSSSVVCVMWTGWRVPASRPNHLLSSSRDAIIYRPLRSTGMPSFAQRCATATGCPKKCAIAGHPVSDGEAGSITGTFARSLVVRFREVGCWFLDRFFFCFLGVLFLRMVLSVALNFPVHSLIIGPFI